MIALILLVFLFCVILSCDKRVKKVFRITYITSSINIIPEYKVSSPRCAILLTTYTGSKSATQQDENRIKMYMKNIHNWLDTGLDIFIVNSSPYIFPFKHPRLKQHSFRQPDGLTSSSLLEGNSVREAYRVFSRFSEYDYVFKITGKYYCPEFPSLIERIPADTDILLQYISVFQAHTEVVGARPEILLEIYREAGIHDSVESCLSDILIENKYRVYKLPKLSIKNKNNRGNGSLLEYL